MSTRISIKDLQEMVDQINDITGHDKDPYDHSKKGCNPNTGTYLIDSAYGGVQLVRMSLTKGCSGQSDITSGFNTKKDLYEKIKGILTGLKMKQN